jgi:hypothetical protein
VGPSALALFTAEMNYRTQFKRIELVLLVAVCCQSFGQGARKSIADRAIPVMKVTRANARDCLYRLTKDYKVPFGIDASYHSRIDENEVGPVIEARTVREVLDALTVFFPEYSWSEIDGVIDISPAGAPDSMLDTMVYDLHVKNKTVNQIKYMIYNTPEVKQALQNSGTKLSNDPEATWQSVDEGRYSFAFHKMTVRQIMNQLIRKTNVKYWVAMRVEVGGKGVYLVSVR